MKRNFKFIFAILATVILLFIMTLTPILADVKTNASKWAVNDIEKSVSIGVTLPSEVVNVKKPVTRQEFAVIAVRFYEKFTNNTKPNVKTSPFTDTKNKDVLAAHSLGIVSGTTKDLFEPDKVITREQMLVMLTNTLNACGVDVKNYQYTEKFNDHNHIAPYAVSAVEFLKYQSILAGAEGNLLYPKREAILEQSIVLLMHSFEKYYVKTFHIGKTEIKLGDSKDSIISKLGQPTFMTGSEYNFDWYCFAKDPGEYIQIGIKNNTVVSIYSNSSKMSYMAISHGITTTQLEKLFNFSEDGNKYIMKDHYSETTVYVDKFTNKVDSVFVIEKSSSKRTFSVGELTISGFEKQLFHLINCARINNKLPALEWDPTVASIAKAHAIDMAANNYEDYTDGAGNSPFDRMKNKGIVYTAAAENIKSGFKSPIDVYNDWLGLPGNRNHIFNADFQKTGVGIAKNNIYKLYYTQDSYKP